MRKLAFVLCGLAAAVALAVGSGGFTSVQADRGVSVDIVGDDNAYMALDYPNGTVERGGAVNETVTLPVVNITNQFTEDVDITVEYTVSETSETSATGANGPTDLDLDVGDTEQVSTAVTCDDTGEDSVTVEFDVTADGNGVYAETSEPRTVDYLVDCS